MTIEIREVGSDDWQEWRQLRLRSLEESPDAFRSTHAEDSARPESWWRESVETSVTDPLQTLWLATLDGMPAGVLSSRVDAESRVMTAEAMWVTPEARGQGIAVRLLDTGLAWARDAGASRAELWVNQGNSSTRSLYRRAGFRPTTEVEQVRPGAPHILVKMSAAL